MVCRGWKGLVRSRVPRADLLKVASASVVDGDALDVTGAETAGLGRRETGAGVQHILIRGVGTPNRVVVIPI